MFCNIYKAILTNTKTAKDVVLIKTSIIFFDHELRKRARVPEKFLIYFNADDKPMQKIYVELLNLSNNLNTTLKFPKSTAVLHSA